MLIQKRRTTGKGPYTLILERLAIATDGKVFFLVKNQQKQRFNQKFTVLVGEF